MQPEHIAEGPLTVVGDCVAKLIEIADAGSYALVVASVAPAVRVEVGVGSVHDAMEPHRSPFGIAELVTADVEGRQTSATCRQCDECNDEKQCQPVFHLQWN